ncbi:MAG: ABC transporter permease [Treponema sp.]|jgi:ribose/xylose/arabinose/galactoside ABC-type transport system permease subunit|nr:ABC transporter permease [Treponema sp.]
MADIKSLMMEKFVRRTAIIWVLLLLIIGMTFFSPMFISPGNLLLVVKQSTITGILGIGMTLVIITGGIDLSVGAVLALSSVCSAMFGGLAAQQLPIIAAILAGVFAGLLFGIINGLIISYLNFPSFIMTLATSMIARGIAKILCNAKPVLGISDSFKNLANGFFLGIPNLAVCFAIVFALGAVLLNKTVLGSRFFAIGGNEIGARLSGVNTKRVKLIAYTFCGILAGFCGVLMTSRISSGSSITGEGYELNAIAAAVIGGTSMSGGVGTIWGTVVGALIIGVIQNGLDFMNVSAFYQDIIKGVIIIIAVLMDLNSKNKKSL